MSHAKERAEKICLNCNTELNGRYCHICGQENTEPRESVWGLITHFAYDITHFDGKFFSTLRLLAFKPGFLTREFMSGHRARYLHPVRMYVFTSALFFIIFFSMFSVKDLKSGNINGLARNIPRMDVLKEEAYKNAKTREDSIEIDKGLGYLEQFGAGNTAKTQVPDSPRNEKGSSEKKQAGGLNIQGSSEYESKRQYDSIQNTLPVTERDGWFEKKLTYMMLNKVEKYGDDNVALYREIVDKIMHTFPYLLFVSLPLYAICLKLLYIRRRKFYYTDHIIFLVHLYIFTFLLLLFFFGLQAAKAKFEWTWIGWPQAILILAGIYYAYKAMRNFYGQGRFKTFTKFILFNIFSIILLSFLFTLFAGFSLFQI